MSGLSREQFEAVERVVNAVVATRAPDEPLGWFTAASTILNAIRAELVLKVDVAPTATATGTIEGLDGLGRRVGQG